MPEPRLEAKCVNPECPANEVWVLDPDNICNICGHEMVEQTEAPPQKMADPDEAPVGAEEGP